MMASCRNTRKKLLSLPAGSVAALAPPLNLHEIDLLGIDLHEIVQYLSREQ
jgi:hypothetical protein